MHIFPTVFLRHFKHLTSVLNIVYTIQANVQFMNRKGSSGLKPNCSLVSVVVYGAFPTSGYPQIIHFYRVFHDKPSILGYLHFRKTPYNLEYTQSSDSPFRILSLCCFHLTPFPGRKMAAWGDFLSAAWSTCHLTGGEWIG